MTKPGQSIVTRDGWDHLKEYTSARIALGRSGGSLPTSEWLDFKLSHARARDAVHLEFDPAKLAEKLRDIGYQSEIIHTCATDRRLYLQRPDLGRRLNDASKSLLAQYSGDFDLVIIASDGLSTMAADRQIASLLESLLQRLDTPQWKIAPILIAPFARVALEDEVGFLLNAQIALILVGERPGLGSPDSLGAYLVFGPKPGNTDAQRNCVSNIRPQGLGFDEAAETLWYLMKQARARKLSGVMLKDERKRLEVDTSGDADEKQLSKPDREF